MFSIVLAAAARACGCSVAFAAMLAALRKITQGVGMWRIDYGAHRQQSDVYAHLIRRAEDKKNRRPGMIERMREDPGRSLDSSHLASE